MFVEQPRQQTQRLFEFAGANPLLKAAMTCLERRILLGQLAPLCPGTEHPKNAIQHGTGLVPRTSAVILATSRTKHRLNQHPLFFGQLPTSSHGRTRRSSEHFQNATDHSPWVFMRLVLDNVSDQKDWKLSSMGNGSESAMRDGVACEIPLLDGACLAGALEKLLLRATGFGLKLDREGALRGAGRR